MSLTEYDAEEVMRDIREECREMGIAEGAQQKAIEAAKNLSANGVSVSIIAESLNILCQCSSD